jgi:perosamine synthetase
MYMIVLRENVRKERYQVMLDMETVGIETRPVFYPMHVLPPYRDLARKLSAPELCGTRGINLPTHGRLTEDDLDRIVEALAASLR